jgi:hypothetical protein
LNVVPVVISVGKTFQSRELALQLMEKSVGELLEAFESLHKILERSRVIFFNTLGSKVEAAPKNI